jgi:hypothetical protein
VRRLLKELRIAPPELFHDSIYSNDRSFEPTLALLHMHECVNVYFTRFIHLRKSYCEGCHIIFVIFIYLKCFSVREGGGWSRRHPSLDAFHRVLSSLMFLYVRPAVACFGEGSGVESRTVGDAGRDPTRSKGSRGKATRGFRTSCRVGHGRGGHQGGRCGRRAFGDGCRCAANQRQG